MREEILGGQHMFVQTAAALAASALAFGMMMAVPSPALAQAPAAKKAAESKNVQQKSAAPSKAAKQWRTPWGDPDLQGSWSNATTTPLQRPAKFAGREFLTEQEKAAQDKESTVATDKRAERGSDEDVNGAYNGFWWDRGLSDGRTSLIYDPPDGKIPALTPEAKQRVAAEARLNPRDKDFRGSNGPEDHELYTRCVMRAPLPRVPTGYDNNYQLVQTPGYVAIFQEQMHETRVIPLDQRPHLDSSVRQWLGDSRGHWEGNTLVVETTNFGDQAPFEGSSKNMRLVERWTRVADDRIDYRFTVDDSAAWAKPWSASIGWTKTGIIYEYACHEDNYSLYGILSGARAQEKKAADQAAQKIR